MPKPAHLRITWSGVYGTAAAPLEQWSFSLSTGGSLTGLSEAGADAYAESMKDLWDAWVKGRQNADVVLTKVRAASIDAGDAEHPGGLQFRNADGSFDGYGKWDGELAGTHPGGTKYPTQCCVVVSLITARAGASGKGRLFLPVPAMALGADHRLSAADASSIRDDFKQLINAYNDLASDEPIAVVSTKGHVSEVTGVRVGRVIDTHRSRRTDMREDYLTTTLDAA